MSDIKPLTALFEADRVAIVGASDRNRYASNIFRNLRLLGFDAARIVPINPNRSEVYGLKAYPSVLAVAEAIPLAVVATNTSAVLPVLRELAEKRVQAAVILADGFGESGIDGQALQQQLATLANEAGMQILGPNCMGFVAVRSGLGLWAGDLPKTMRAGNIGCIFQSSGMLNLIMNLGTQHGLGFHLAVSGGNEAVLKSADYLFYAGDRAEIEVISMFMEAAPKDPKRFVAALDRAVANGKSVVILRAGKTERAKRNVIAHTGQLAGAAEAWNALLEQHGAVLVEDLDDLLETTALFSGAPARPSRHEKGVGIITISGGDCTLLCDISEQEDVPLPELSVETQRVVIESLDKPTVIGNPLDVESLQRQDEAAFDRCLTAFFHEPRIDMVGIRFNLPDLPGAATEKLYQRIADLRAESGKRVVQLSRATEPLVEEWYALFRKHDLPFVREYRKGLRALRRLRNNESDRANERFNPAKRPEPSPARFPFERGVLSFEATSRLLKAYGIPLAPTILADSAQAAERAAEKMGYPCVLKIASIDIPHKTELGGLALDLKDREAVRKAYEEITSRVGQAKPNARIEGMVVQRQLKGVECLLGLSRDEQLGPLIVMGLGGIFVELLADVATRVPPITEMEARRALDGLKGSAIFRGVRGAPPADVQALAQMAARLSWLAHDLRDDITELDLNPVVLLPEGQGGVAVDALVVVENAKL